MARVWNDFSNNIPRHASKFAIGQNRCNTRFGKGCKTIWNRFVAFCKGDDDVYQACDDRKHRDEAEQILNILARNGQVDSSDAESMISALKSIYFNRQCPDLSIFAETAAKYPQYKAAMDALENQIC